MPYLYAIQMVIPGYPIHPIKIGMTTTPHMRESAYRSGPFPVAWLGAWDVDDPRPEEKSIHLRFEDFRMVGEWFYPAEQLIAFVQLKIGRSLSEVLAQPPRHKTKGQFQTRFLRLFPDGEESIEREWEEPGKAVPCNLNQYLGAFERMSAIQ